ncbi:unnamed protein product [Rhodiola kirilowii]
MKKFVVIGVSAILVVGAVIGVIVGVNKTGSSGSSASSQDVDLSTSGKAVATLCTPTDYKKTCVDTLSAVANNQSATPMDFLKAAIDVTMQGSGSCNEENFNYSPRSHRASNENGIRGLSGFAAVCNRRAASFVFICGRRCDA